LDNTGSGPQLERLRTDLERLGTLAYEHHYNQYSGRIRREAESPDMSVRRKLLLDLLAANKVEEDGEAEFQYGCCTGYPDEVYALWAVIKVNHKLVLELVQEADWKYKSILFDRLWENATEEDARVALSLYRSKSSAVRASALSILAKVSLPGTDAIFLDAAHDKSEVVRSCAAEGLADRPGKPFETLLNLCLDSSDTVRGRAIDALPSESSAPVRETLVKMLKSSDPDIRSLGCRTIGTRVDKLLAPELAKLLHDPVEAVASTAMSALDDLNLGP
jgi:hypothetical protein